MYIELKNISFGYKKTGFAIQDVSLSLQRDEATFIVGSNGSGKTTLSKLIMGMLKIDKGRVIITDQDMSHTSLSSVAKRIGYLFQNPDKQLFCTSALEEIMFSLQHAGVCKEESEGRAKMLLERFSMLDKASDFPLKLSRGEKQRLALLSVIAIEPPYYLLDEPSSGIDLNNKRKLIAMLKSIKENGAGMCVITHDKMLIEQLADRVITMAQGRIVGDEKTRS